MSKKKILYIVNATEYFVSHRFELAKQAKASGYQINVASDVMATEDQSAINKIKAAGFYYHHLPIKRSGQNPFYELLTLLKIYRLIKKLDPSLIHLVTIKPVIYGGIAARLVGKQNVVAAIAGLGTTFIGDSFLSKLRKVLISFMLRLALKAENTVVIFQNQDDRNTLNNLGILSIKQTRLIKGSGVALADYPFISEPTGKPVIVMAARLLKDKGVFEFVEAASLLRKRGKEFEMRLIGVPDLDNPTSITEKDLKRWEHEGAVRLFGYRDDIAEQYAAANIVCLPSYREGLPKSLIEAAACGRAVVTTDVAGCRDSIKPNETGLLVQVKDSVALADAIQKLVEDSELRKRMGKAGRALAENDFAIEKIVTQHLQIYLELLSD